MTMQYEGDMKDLESGPQTWSEVWIKAITQPSVATYQDFVNRPGVSSRRAYTWIFLGSLAGSALTLFGILVFGSLSTLGADQATELLGGIGFMLLSFACLAPLSGLISVLGLIIAAGISQLIASALGGSGTYTELSYVFAAYMAPLGIAASVLSMVPFVNCLAIPLALYGLILNILAIKSIHRFDWVRAIASSVIFILMILLLGVVVVIIVLALLGPAIGNVFSNMIQEIGTPMP